MTLMSLPSAAPQQIYMFGLDETQDRHQAILAHAMAVVQNYINMRESALRLCVSLYLCREEFKQTGDTGWGNFCKANFSQLGLSEGNIRSAVNAGRAISHYLASLKNTGEEVELTRLDSMSRSALTVLGEAPEEVRNDLINRVIEAGEMRNSALSAREVENELIKLRQEKAEADQSRTEAMGKLTSMDQALNRMNALVRDREGQIGTLQTQIDTLHHQLSQAAKQTPVVVQEADPSSKMVQEAKRNMERQLSELQHQVTQAQAELGREKAEAEKLARQNALKKQSADAIDALEQQVARIKAQWSDAYAQKIRSQDPHTLSPLLTRIANDMRFLADQLDPTLV